MISKGVDSKQDVCMQLKSVV